MLVEENAQKYTGQDVLGESESVCGLHISTLWFTVLGNQATSTRSPGYCERLTQKDLESTRFSVYPPGFSSSLPTLPPTCFLPMFYSFNSSFALGEQPVLG